MDPELNRYILLNEKKGLIPGYPKSMVDILGNNIAAVYGPTHKYIRNNLLSLVGTPLVKNLLPKLDEYMRILLSDWDCKTIDIQDKTMEVSLIFTFFDRINHDIKSNVSEMAFLVQFKQIAEAEWSSIYDRFKTEFDKLYVGTISLPIYLPGTNYHHGFKARINVTKILAELMERRRASAATCDDMLEHLLRDVDTSTTYKLNDVEIIDQIVTILYSGYETVSTTSMMAVKYLHDHPEALQQLREENFAIRNRKKAEEPLDWDDLKSMKFTRSVVYETLRLATVINGVLRKTTDDITLNGFVIPKGWRIYVYTREINYDPILYPEPFKFNPWRWLDGKLESHNYFLVFGGGTRLCPGKELGVAKVSTFLHYFVTTYRWEEVGGEEIVKFPRVEAPNGYHINVKKI
ncbi:Cytochrome P450 CYP4/CYP19/CYP26 subfamily [Handroanthus impetiginosus]|uniref:Cytochrome P450 CYP4/CYP19/CYP26 subfamily n=1 Tax=Handroanthus impetiginosus TaxID=429701 RepID=A0A2G9HSB8_9LAMI|nr:Cytochrome P450 CYP4/CYP19/CYP26 subfamily [Handroanthus impetiginosus]